MFSVKCNIFIHLTIIPSFKLSNLLKKQYFSLSLSILLMTPDTACYIANPRGVKQNTHYKKKMFALNTTINKVYQHKATCEAQHGSLKKVAKLSRCMQLS
jgi:hypothetical protein